MKNNNQLIKRVLSIFTLISILILVIYKLNTKSSPEISNTTTHENHEHTTVHTKGHDKDHSLPHQKSINAKNNEPESKEPLSDKTTASNNIPEAPSKDYSLENFENDLDFLKKNFPLKSKMKGKLTNSQVHHIPDFILSYGRVMARMKKYIKDYPENNFHAFQYYEQCSLNADVYTSIRSLCLYNTLELSEALDKRIDLTNYPQEVVELAKSLEQ